MEIKCLRCGKPIPEENYETGEQVIALCKKHAWEWHDQKLTEIFDDNFDDVLEEANQVYQKHKEKKGESWKDCNIVYLRRKLEEEYKEWANDKEYADEYKELLDIINISLMLAKRIKEEGGSPNSSQN